MAELELEQHDRTLVLRINRPHVRNALSPTLLEALGRAIREADRDDALSSIIITAAGDRAFCSGEDLNFVADGVRNNQVADIQPYIDFLRHGCQKPVIGAANGIAVAGGFELLLACDIVVASESARFGLPEVRVGLFAAIGAIQLPRRVPRAIALELLLTGAPIEAPRALALGLVNRIAPSGRVLEEALRLAGEIDANGPLAVRASKRLALETTDHTFEEMWHRRQKYHDQVFDSEDAVEGARAFLAKRPPRWVGK